MKSAVETLNPTRVKLTVEVPYEELKPSVDAAYKTIAQQVTVPGFRKGKVPPRIIDQRIGRGAVLEEAVNAALPGLYARAIEESEIRPLSTPQVEVTAVPEGADGPLTFTAEVDVRPEITLPDLDTLAVTVDDAEISDEDVDELLDNLRERFGTTLPVERPAAEGDVVSLDLTAVVDGDEIDSARNISHIVGSGSLLPGTDEAITGLSAGESITFDAPLAGGEHEGDVAQVTASLIAVKERTLPEPDDEFAQTASEFDTIAELRDSLREQAGRGKLFEQGLQARERLVEYLLEVVQFPIPDGLVEQEVHSHLEGEGRLEDDEHRAEVTEEAQRGIRAQLLLDALAEAEQVQVGQQELVEYLVQTSQQYGMDPNAFIQAVSKNGQLSAMVGEVARRKALAQILERTTVRDASGRTLDLSELFAEPAGEADDDTAGAEGAPAVNLAAGETSPAPASAVPAVADPTAISVSDIGGFIPDDEPQGAVPDRG